MPSAPSRVTIAAGGTQQREHDSDADHLGVALDAEQAAKALELEPASAEVAYHHASYLRSFGDLLRARQMLSDAALVHAEEPAIASSLGYLLLSERGAAGAAARRHGLQVLTRAAESGAWRGGAPWQHPVEYLSAVPPPPAGGVRPRGAYECLLSPLEGAAADLAAEAAAALERFTVQTEGIARPQGGWRELDLFDVATCAAVRAAVETYPYVQGALFSALAPGTALSPHCGPTNGRMVMHVGLRVPHPGAARLRIGRPSSLDDDVQGSAPADAAVEVAWREAEGFVWDDSVCHEPRIVLLLLLLHPAMTRMPICPALDAS
ncbi:hypothetical protein EMIHUDRAFT_450138 [Emiliania huxleyi CCMP1516]|uniref:Aspartyl/asparaginy/proline hydroxylase domain-containing protein n=2 Tax=Emiliania huxleyi TaxID=2903 RepID=A0A0D3JU88_EMIH1|nr:hypothetical protein EMIHUDRAFT_450138 [Emiliania huxleyi CCMP1516]EOD27073.1 hypothetical protein EMIHUDRAFT_450138 [Emiliania huxleyi CCMP1516]|eukprot:XP_005779502.1 hypothetical protein EMIHUDRAFT_450138 [Emiliania huxleyi CCMP1516]